MIGAIQLNLPFGYSQIEVNIWNTTSFNSLLNEVVLYYNEYPVSRLSHYTNNFTLTAYVLPNYDNYKVRFEGFLVVPHDRSCEKALLDVLHYYPAFQAATFPNNLTGKLILHSTYTTCSHI